VLEAQARYQIQAKEIELTLSNEIILFMLARLIVKYIQGHKILIRDPGSQHLQWNSKNSKMQKHCT
jgi:hypothetical protein